MDENELKSLLEDFYEVRGDRYAKPYLLDFIKLVSDSNISPSMFNEWLEVNIHKFGLKYEKNTLKIYQSVLRQFVRYVVLAEELGQNYSSKSNKSKNKIKIYDTFYSFQQNCSDKFF